MATKFVAAVAFLALCHANPVLINGILYRDGRAYSVGQASSYDGGAQAYGSATSGAQLARDKYYYPEQAIAQAQSYDAPPFPKSAYGGAKAVAQAQTGAYYPFPAPATVITYGQNFAPAASSESHVVSDGAGNAHSSANTQGGAGGYGETSSNAITQGSGSADSSAKSGLGFTSSSVKSHGEASAASSAQNNGVVYPAAPTVVAYQPAVIDARTPIYYTSNAPVVTAQGVASSNVDVIGSGNAASSAKFGHGQGKTISWRFGTLYDAPASAHAQANTQAGYGAAKSAAHSRGYGSAKANADVHGHESTKSFAKTHNAGHSVAQSSANSYGAGSANANANVNSAGYGSSRSTADVHGQYYGGYRNSANAYTHGSGSSGLRVANSQAHSSGPGSAHASALSA